jgi:hypothetical protein
MDMPSIPGAAVPPLSSAAVGMKSQNAHWKSDTAGLMVPGQRTIKMQCAFNTQKNKDEKVLLKHALRDSANLTLPHRG